MSLPQLNRATQITLLAAAVLAGILIGRQGYEVNPIFIPACLAVACVLRLITSRQSFYILLVGVVLLGIWRGNTTIFAKTDLGKLIGQKVALSGQIIDDPAVNSKNRVVYTLGDLSYQGKLINGAVRVTTTNKKLQRGETVVATGKIQTSLGSVPARMGFGLTQVVPGEIGGLEQLRQRFFAGIRTAIPEPLSGFGLGLLIGVRGLVPADLQSQLTLVGLSHLVAVSGYNLTIIVQAAYRLVGRISTYMATAASLWLIAGFLLVTGFSASIVRASAVALLALLTSYYGYRIKPMALVALPAGATALVNPDYLTRDVGWQLSFLAFFGIIVIAPMIEARIKRDGIMLSLIVQSLVAQLLTFPLILYIFGTLSVISPVSNALIVPLVPLAMLLSFVVGMVALLSPVLAGWLALPAIGLLAIMVGLVQTMAAWPSANIGMSANGWQIALAYASIMLITLLLWRRHRPVIAKDDSPAGRLISGKQFG